ncbi:hypothetical protein J6590_024017 [Homalodisca vitripennis]|nr:hypothetical protein J6590_024017 [Homalodisca vitripennis]
MILAVQLPGQLNSRGCTGTLTTLEVRPGHRLLLIPPSPTSDVCTLIAYVGRLTAACPLPPYVSPLTQIGPSFICRVRDHCDYATTRKKCKKRSHCSVQRDGSRRDRTDRSRSPQCGRRGLLSQLAGVTGYWIIHRPLETGDRRQDEDIR